MANISLRSYQQEIERLIDSGRTEEALVHCHHILQKFPRSVDTYRLLGKTFLESQRYGDAADIFQRVLSAIPDDFVSHVGMSIIREDEGNLDEAIWHMERAFEIQPSNSAIQEELRRLFERRDDIEPPKIRLTRSALARMYAKGGLYDQAIAESRAILAADANRLDILVLLARVQANADNQVEAAESASNVLQKLPYCLEANRVMAEVLAESDRVEEAQPYRQRVISLVPYDAYINEDYPTSEDVPEQTIMIEKIVYKPGEVPDIESGQPSWATSLGVRISELGSGMDEIPDWLTVTSEEETEGLEKPPEPAVSAPDVEAPGEDIITETPTPGGDDIPAWMKEAGWGPSSGVVEEVEFQLSIEEESEFTEEETDIAKAEIPAWLQAMAPTDEETPTPGEELEALEELDLDSELPDWLGEESATPIEIPDWLSSIESETPTIIAEQVEEISTPVDQEPLLSSEEEVPDWLQEFVPESEKPDQEPLPSEEIPEWLMEVEGAEEVLGITHEEGRIADEAPDWLGEVEEEALEETPEELLEAEASEKEIPEWLTASAIAATAVAAAERLDHKEEPAEAEELQAEELPEWLEEFEGAGEVFEVEAESLELEEEAETALAEELPEWLMEIEDVEEEIEVGAEVFELEEEVEAQLAEELPEWLAEFEGAGEAPEEEAEALELEEEAEPAEEIPEWLTAGALSATAVTAVELLDHEEVPAEAEAEALPAEELPEWLTEIAGAEEALEVEPEAVEHEEEAVAVSAEELPEWLMEIEGAEEALEVEPETLELEEGAEAAPVEELPEWLMEIEGAEEALEVEAEVLELEEEVEARSAEELPEWLDEFEGVEEAPEVEAEALELEEEAETAEEIPEWLTAGAVAATAITAAEMLDYEEESFETEAGALPAEELPEWLKEIPGAEEALEVEPEALEIEEVGEAVPAEELPEWLDEFESAEEAPEVDVEALEKEEEVEAPLAEELPEWLEEFEGVEEAPEEKAAALELEEEAEPAEEIPEWLAAGAVAASAVVAAEILDHKEEPAEPTEAEAPSAKELPEWLAEFEGVEEAPETDATVMEPEEEVQAVPTEELPEWPMEIEGAEEAPEVEAKALEFEEEVEAQPAEELPEWLAEFEGFEEAPEPEVDVLEPEEEAVLADEFPDWLLEIEGAEEALMVEAEEEVEAAPMEEEPEWLEEIEVVEEALEAEVEALEPKGEAEPSEEIPEWLAAGAVIASAVAAAEILDMEKEPAEPVEGELFDEEDIPEFLKKPRDLEITPVSPEEPETWEAAYDLEEHGELILGDTQPTRVRIPDESAEPEEAPPLGETEVEAISEPTWEEPDQVEAAVEEELEQLPPLDDEAAAFAWLEGLAVKQGADEALLLIPEERLEAPPEWVQEAEEEVIPEVPEAVIEGPVVEETETILEAGEEIAVVAPEEISEVEKPEGEAVEEIDEDLKAETPAVDDDAAFAWLEALAVKQGVEEALLLTAEERVETPPEWVQEAEEEAVVEGMEAEMTLEVPVEAVESAKTVPTEEPMVEELLEVEVPTEAVEEVEEPAKALDDEAAFAWLEALAVKQGAHEALLLTPEERLEAPPEWVQEVEEETELEVVEGEEELGLEEALATISAAHAALEEVVELEEAAPPPESITEGLAEEIPAVEVSEEITEEALAEAVKEEFVEPTAELEEPIIEAPEMIEEVAEAVETVEEEREPEETVPDLPDWLAQEPPTSDVELEWTPPLVQLELNQASLAELERLPGIGFIMAQRIINYREQAGGFHSLDDLLLVPEFDESNLEELKERLYVEYVPTPEPETRPIKAEPILDETSVIPELTDARGALNENDLSTAIQHYARLIKSNQLLTEVIEDLSLATEHYPEDVGVWQSLGDAYLRSNQIKEALEAYIKAEKLLR